MKSKFIPLNKISKYTKRKKKLCSRNELKQKINKKTKRYKLSKKKLKKILKKIDDIKFSLKYINGKTFKKKK